MTSARQFNFDRLRRHRPRQTAIALVLGGIASVQTGAALATTLFDELGPAGAVFARVALSALILVALWRPSAAGLRGAHRGDLIAFGIALAAMNFGFYLALDRIPLGITVTLEFIGPLGVAVAFSHRRLDLLWVALAAGGIVLLAPGPNGDLDPLGIVFALVAGCFWGAYIVLSSRVGRRFAGGDGLALAMCVAAAALLPAGVAGGGASLLQPSLLAVALAVAVLSSAIPYSVELEALRRLPRSTFGVLMSLEPAVAALVGLVGLDQGLAAREVAAIALVVIASAGALRGAPATAEA